MALSDSQVEKQINHMRKFIEQEAQEKAEEIGIKAEEEFNIEKGRLLQNEKRKVANFYERKEKQLELQRKIQHSNLLNQARLSTLKMRDDCVHEIVEEARGRLDELAKDRGKYSTMLKALIVQGMCQLLEENVVVRCRQKDVSLVKSILPETVSEYEKKSKLKGRVVVDEKDFLSNDSFGGVVLLAHQGKITITNTLDSRLSLLSDQMMPEIRSTLFGVNPNRHFLD